MFRHGDSGRLLVLQGEAQSAPGRNSGGVLSHDQMWNMAICETGCRGYKASRMTDTAGVGRPSVLQRSNEKSQTENFRADARDARAQ